MATASSRLKFNEYSVIKDIGRGTFGIVYSVRRGKSKQVYALKKIDLQPCDEKEKEHALNEVEILRNFKHEHLLEYFDSFRHGDSLCIVTEYCMNGTLRDFILQQKKLSESLTRIILTQICIALQYLHGKNIAHRDVKSSNIFFTCESKVKLGDMGVAKCMDKVTCVAGLTRCVGTPYYMSPEMLNGCPYTLKTDIWSLAFCLYEMATGRRPFEDRTLEDLKENYNSGKINSVTLPGYSEDMVNLFRRMVEMDPERRPTIQEVLIAMGKEEEVEEGIAESSRVQVCEEQETSEKEGSSGYNSDQNAHAKHFIVATVQLNEEEKDLHDMAVQQEKMIFDKIEKDNEKMDKIKEILRKTRNMEDSKKFLSDVGGILTPDQFRKSKPFLTSLWEFKSPILKHHQSIIW